MGKTNPLNDKDVEGFIESQKSNAETENSWTFKVGDIDEETFDLSPKNPNTPEEAPLRSPEEILEEMESLDKETANILGQLKSLIV